MSTTISINGQTITFEGSANNVQVKNGVVMINGKVVDGNYQNDKVINVTVNGNVDNLSTASGDITVTGNVETIQTASGDIKVHGDIKGNITTASGDVSAKTINGNVSSMSGDITT